MVTPDGIPVHIPAFFPARDAAGVTAYLAIRTRKNLNIETLAYMPELPSLEGNDDDKKRILNLKLYHKAYEALFKGLKNMKEGHLIQGLDMQVCRVVAVLLDFISICVHTICQHLPAPELLLGQSLHLCAVCICLHITCQHLPVPELLPKQSCICVQTRG